MQPHCLRGLGGAPARRCAAPAEASVCPAAVGSAAVLVAARPAGTGAPRSCRHLLRLAQARCIPALLPRARASSSAVFPFLPPRLPQPLSASSPLFPLPVSLPEGDMWTLLRYYIFVFPVPCVEILILCVGPPTSSAALGCVCTLIASLVPCAAQPLVSHPHPSPYPPCLRSSALSSV